MTDAAGRCRWEAMTVQASYYVQDAMQVFVTMEEIELDVAGRPWPR